VHQAVSKKLPKPPMHICWTSHFTVKSVTLKNRYCPEYYFSHNHRITNTRRPYSLWKNRWVNSTDKYRQTKIWFGEADPQKSVYIINNTRQMVGRYIQWLTGHGWLNRHANKIDSSHNPTCRLCEEEFTTEDPDHIWWVCPAIERDRVLIKGTGRPRSWTSSFGATQLSSSSTPLSNISLGGSVAQGLFRQAEQSLTLLLC
jgi:hypothetical protein